ncbi:MAG TPA: adenosine deaminase [Acidimicrobiia bacterium]
MVDFQILPKVVLHDHLDGGLRPATVLDLAEEVGYQGLPKGDAAGIARWFHQGEAASLESYLDTFRHTSGVMQTPTAMRRVAFEAIADHAAQGVVYAEVRFAPSLHTRLGMTRAEAIAGVLEGLTDAADSFGVPSGLIVDALRQDDDSAEVAATAAAFAGRGVVAFDLAGPERGNPASDHAEACGIATAAGLRLTIHAGEGDGVASIADALAVGAERIGHGVRIIEDASAVGGRITTLGPVATTILTRRVPLEVCPTSNLHTGMYPSAAAHPVGALYRAGFAVTLNTDNRLMSGITMTDEFALAAEHQGFTKDDLRTVTLQAVEAAFCAEGVRSEIRERVLAGFA